uniref:Uncharacterized protein n=1 Tax=Solanum lycopersicum TaxID=4081 RepID=A0A3Q7JI54_SOLLC
MRTIVLLTDSFLDGEQVYQSRTQILEFPVTSIFFTLRAKEHFDSKVRQQWKSSYRKSFLDEKSTGKNTRRGGNREQDVELHICRIKDLLCRINWMFSYAKKDIYERVIEKGYRGKGK